MSGRVAAVTGRATFDLVRERLGPRVGAGEPGRVVPRHVADLHRGDRRCGARDRAGHQRQLPARGARSSGFAVWLVIWRVQVLRSWSRSSGCSGLALVVFARRAVAARARTGATCWHQVAVPRQAGGGGPPTYWYYAIALFGAAMTPVRGVLLLLRRRRGALDAARTCDSRVNVFVGFPLGGLLSLAIAACAAIVFLPLGIQVDTLGQVGLPVARRRWASSALAVRDPGLLRGHVRRGAGDRAVDRIHDRPVLRLAVGQVRAAARGGPVPPRRARCRRSSAVAGVADHGRPDQGDRVLARVLGGRAAADLLPDPRRRQRPGVHG